MEETAGSRSVVDPRAVCGGLAPVLMVKQVDAMSIKVIINKDFDAVSESAANFVRERARTAIAGGKVQFVLGLATGNSPTGMYKHLARSINQGEIDPKRLGSFNLDEYVGLPGANAQERTIHPESYSYFMIQEFFGLLNRKFSMTMVPAGTLIDQHMLVAELEAHPDAWIEAGTGKGRAIVIREDVDGYLGWVRDNVLARYDREISTVGGIDLQVIGVGGKGHVAFHEAGIAFEGNRMLLVRLDDNTVENAVRDGHFEKMDDCPLYAVSMGAELVFEARTVVLLADGPRKVEPITRAILGEVSPGVPLSYCQTFSERGGELICFIDKAAGQELLENKELLKSRGVVVEDRTMESARVSVADISFHRDPVSGRLV